jgi:uncharacterized protein YdhG (YjbR/CyaY superfamily)
MASEYKSIDQYIASQPQPAQEALQRVRRAIRDAMPGAEEVISYKMPALKLHGKTVIYFAAWKQHLALYPGSKNAIAAFRDELAQYELKKGTIQFPLSQPVPTKLIAQIAKFRADEVAERKPQKSTKSTKSTKS